MITQLIALLSLCLLLHSGTQTVTNTRQTTATCGAGRTLVERTQPQEDQGSVDMYVGWQLSEKTGLPLHDAHSHNAKRHVSTPTCVPVLSDSCETLHDCLTSAHTSQQLGTPALWPHHRQTPPITSSLFRTPHPPTAHPSPPPHTQHWESTQTHTPQRGAPLPRVLPHHRQMPPHQT
jgi:hypothetical protein